jgi:hypothetical protein
MQPETINAAAQPVGGQAIVQAQNMAATLAQQTTQLLQTQPLIGYIVLGLAALVLALIAGVIICTLFKGNAAEKIAGFLCESDSQGSQSKPSVSRLQMLIWNFTVAFAFLYVLATRAEIYSAIKAILQPEILVLLGISNTTYLLGKNSGKKPAAVEETPPGAQPLRGGQPLAQGEIGLGAPGPQGTP